MSLDDRIKYATMKAKHENKLRPWYKKPWGVIIIIIGLLLLILAASFTYYLGQALNEVNNVNNGKYSEELTNQYLAAVNRNNGNKIGPDDARVKIVEFADFICPYCQDFHASLKNIRNKYPKQVQIIYRDFPLHENSILLALSARCAGEQNKFWEMHDLFFENQERFETTQTEVQAVMPDIAQALGLDREQFENCLDEQKYFPQIEQDYNDATFLEIEGTPTWFLNNIPFTGAMGVSELESLIKNTLR